mgnify:FL=1
MPRSFSLDNQAVPDLFPGTMARIPLATTLQNAGTEVRSSLNTHRVEFE